MAGGEGDSGGYIEPSFVLCRDGVYASTMILKLIQSGGSLSDLLSQFTDYYQDRGRVEIDRSLAPQILSVLAITESDPDLTDGVKVRMNDKSWVLIRGANTENVLESRQRQRALKDPRKLVKDYIRKINEIATEVLKSS